MFKKFFKLVKKVVVAFLIIYTYNVLSTPLNLTIPINLITVTFVTFLGIPALFLFVIMMMMFF